MSLAVPSIVKVTVEEGRLTFVSLHLALECVNSTYTGYYPGRTRVWRWCRETKKLMCLVTFLEAMVSSLLKTSSTGKEHYAQFPDAWFQFYKVALAGRCFSFSWNCVCDFVTFLELAVYTLSVYMHLAHTGTPSMC